MRILITNDDGITAPGLAILADIAEALAGPEGEVWTVAPATEQSGVGHCISYTRPALMGELGPRRYAIEGTPADCVLAALHHILPEAPDLILSGINHGNNAGENALYSGTLGAAMEGALQGVRSIALSSFIGPENADDVWGAAAAHGAAAVHEILDRWPEEAPGYGLFWNVNFPPCPAEAVGPLGFARQGYRGHRRMGMAPAQAPNRRRYLWITGSDQAEAGMLAESDLHLLAERRIAAVPMRADLTDMALLAELAK